MDEKKYISSVKMVDGSVYNIKDAEAHVLLESLFNGEIIIDCGGAPIDTIIEE
jgi:hypothetical protein